MIQNKNHLIIPSIGFHSIPNLNKLLLNHMETKEQIAWLWSRRVQLIFIKSWCVKPKQSQEKPTPVRQNTTADKTNPNICWEVNSVWPGERKLVGSCVALFLQRWIPACLTPTLHEHKTTLCDCWLLPGLITILLRTVKPKVRATDLLKQCWYCV